MDKDDRVALVMDRLDFERDPAAFNARAEDEMQKLREQIQAAREMLPKVRGGGLVCFVCVAGGVLREGGGVVLCGAFTLVLVEDICTNRS